MILRHLKHQEAKTHKEKKKEHEKEITLLRIYRMITNYFSSMQNKLQDRREK